MTPRSAPPDRIIALFVAGLLAFSYPLLSTVDRLWLPFGVPVLIVYLFGVWAAIVALTALIAWRTPADPSNAPREPEDR